MQAKHGGFGEAKATLKILVDLYRQQEDELNNVSSNAKTKALTAKLAALEGQTEKQKELCLQADLRDHL